MSNKLNDNTRTEIIDFLFDCMRMTMFGGGLEDDYIRDGISFKGLNNYTDQELLEEWHNYSGEDDELYQRAIAEMTMTDLINE